MTDGSTPDDSPLRGFITRGGWFGIATLAQVLAAVAVLPLVTRLLGPAEFGLIVPSLVILQILTVLVGFGLPASVTREVFDGGTTAAREVTTLGLALALITVAGLAATTTLWTPWVTGSASATGTTIATLAAAPAAAAQLQMAFLRAAEDTRGFVTVSVTNSLGVQLLGLAAVAAFQPTADTYMMGLLGGHIAALAVSLVWVRPAPRFPSRTLSRRSFGLALPTVPHLLSFMVLVGADRVIVERLQGPSSAARYHIAYLVGALAISSVSAVNNGWSPLVYGADDSRRWAVHRAITRLVWTVAAASAIVLGALAPILLRLVAPGEYSPAALTPVTATIGATVAPYVLYLTAAVILFQERKSGVLALATPVVAALNVALNLWLVPRVGLMGAALATLVSYLLLAGATLARARAVQPLAVPAPPSRRAAVLLILLVPAALLPTDGWWLLPRMLMAAAAAAVAAGVVRGALTR